MVLNLYLFMIVLDKDIQEIHGIYYIKIVMLLFLLLICMIFKDLVLRGKLWISLLIRIKEWGMIWVIVGRSVCVLCWISRICRISLLRMFFIRLWIYKKCKNMWEKSISNRQAHIQRMGWSNALIGLEKISPSTQQQQQTETSKAHKHSNDSIDFKQIKQ